MLVVDTKRTVDMSPLKRIRLRSRAASELKAKGSMRAQKLNVRWSIVDINSSSHAGEQIDACSKTERCLAAGCIVRLSCPAPFRP